MAKADDYRRLTVPQKQRVALDRQREPSVVCPSCETQTTAADLVQHLDRCTGPRAPHPLSRWITWAEAMRLGVPRGTMSRWVQRGAVRIRITAGTERRYLLRDLAARLAERRSRREFHSWNRRTPK
jgi:hypothetical protein